MKEFALTLVLFASILTSAQVGTYKIEYEYDIIAKEKNPDLSLLPLLLQGDKITCHVGENELKAVLTNEGKVVSTFIFDGQQNMLFERVSNKKYGVKYIGGKEAKSSVRKTGKYDIVADKRCYIGAFGEESETEIKFSPEVQSKFDLPFYGFSELDNFWLILTDRQIIMEKKFEFPSFYIVQKVVNIEAIDMKEISISVPEGEFYYSAESVDKTFEMKDPASTFKCLFKKIKKPEELNEEITVYIEFVLTKEGSIKHVSSYNEVPYDLHKKSLKAFSSCQPELDAAVIKEQPVSSVCYFPIKIRPGKD